MLLYNDVARPRHRIAASPNGRWLGAASLDSMESPETRCLPVWDLGRWHPLPNAVVDIVPDVLFACPAPGSDGFASATVNTVTRIVHIPPDLVVDQWTSDAESSSPPDFLLRHDL